MRVSSRSNTSVFVEGEDGGGSNGWTFVLLLFNFSTYFVIYDSLTSYSIFLFLRQNVKRYFKQSMYFLKMGTFSAELSTSSVSLFEADSFFIVVLYSSETSAIFLD
jgi:hypothetical protein